MLVLLVCWVLGLSLVLSLALGHELHRGEIKMYFELVGTTFLAAFSNYYLLYLLVTLVIGIRVTNSTSQGRCCQFIPLSSAETPMYHIP